MTQPIDYLIAALSQTTDDASVIGANQIRDQRNDDLGTSQNIQNEDPSVPVSVPPENTSSPTNTPRRIQLVKLLSSSSLKRKQHKYTNCLYCSRFCFSRKQTETHLRQSELCQALYMRKEKVHAKP